MDRSSFGLQPEHLTSIWLGAYVVVRISFYFRDFPDARVHKSRTLPSVINIPRTLKLVPWFPWVISCLRRRRRKSAEWSRFISLFSSQSAISGFHVHVTPLKLLRLFDSLSFVYLLIQKNSDARNIGIRTWSRYWCSFQCIYTNSTVTDLTSDGPNRGPNLITVILGVEQHAYLEIHDISNTPPLFKASS